MNTLKAPDFSGLRPVPAGHAASSVGAVLGLLLLPKCPLCVAAYLAGLGLSASVATGAAPFVRPLAFGLAAATLLRLVSGVWRWRRRARGATSAACCVG